MPPAKPWFRPRSRAETPIYRLGGGPGETAFQRGDANADGALDLSDAITILDNLFTGGPAPSCERTADLNGDGRSDISDPVALLGFLYLGTREPAAPHGACGTGAIAEVLTCSSYAPCQ